MRTVGMGTAKKEASKADTTALKKENKKLQTRISELEKEKEGLVATIKELEKENKKDDPVEKKAE